MVPEEVILTSGNKEEIFDIRAEYPFCIRRVTTTWGKRLVVTWHWHEEFEFLYVKDGQLEYWVAGKCILLKKGDGIFINSNVMHQVTVPKGIMEAKEIVFMFRGNFLAEKDSLLEKKYVRPILYRNRLQAVVLRNKNIVHREILDKLLYIEETETEKRAGYEMFLRNQMGDMWVQFLHSLNIESDFVKGKSYEKEERLKKMLTCIHQEYGNELSLEDIARAAGISKRECLRCFQEEIHMTPFNYLKEYRLEMACILLKNTDDTITTVAQKCGFQSLGYFGKVFRKTMGLTPGEFRKNPLKV